MILARQQYSKLKLNKVASSVLVGYIFIIDKYRPGVLRGTLGKLAFSHVQKIWFPYRDLYFDIFNNLRV